MPSDSWMVPGLAATTPIEEAARLAFAVRFTAVDNAWLAGLQSPNNVDCVHQLRVTSRRGSAALRVFGKSLPQRTRAKLKKAIGGIRRIVGAARDEDVLSHRLHEWLTTCDEAERPGLDWLAGSFAKRSRVAHNAVRETESRYEKWHNLVQDLELLPLDKSDSLADLAAKQIPKQIAEFETVACTQIDTPKQLHELRIAGKRLRYSLELLSVGLPGADRLARELPNAQDILGTAHDARTIADRLDKRLAVLDSCSPDDQSRFRKGIVIWNNALGMEAAAGPVRFRLWHRAWQALLAETHLR